MKLSSDDMVTLDAKYHAACLAALYNREAALQEKSDFEKDYRVRQAITHAELMAYIDETRQTVDVPLFTVSNTLINFTQID